jgi:hypothetical protein
MELSLSDLKSLIQPPSVTTDQPFVIGTAYLFRTIGYHWLGRVKAISGKFLILTEASWIADTGRYSEALEGKITSLPSSEIEPAKRDVIINSDHITDASEYPFQLPKDLK